MGLGVSRGTGVGMRLGLLLGSVLERRQTGWSCRGRKGVRWVEFEGLPLEIRHGPP